VVVSAVLLYFFLNSESDTNEVKQIKVDRKYTDEELKKIIPGEIDTMLFSYGIKKDWIKDGGSSNTKGEKKNEKASPNLWFAKDVSVPLDLTTIEITSTLTSLLRYYGLEEQITEDPKSRNVNADIFFTKDSLKKTVANVKLVYSDKIKRDAADVCFILNNITDFKSNELNDALNSTENFSIVLPLTNDKSDVQANILNSRKDFLLKFSLGNEEDIEADFKTGQANIREWKIKIKSVSFEFPKTGGVIIENPIRDYPFEEKIRDEFQKGKINTYKDTLLIKFNSQNTDEKKIYDLFTDIITRTKNGFNNYIYLLNLTPAEFAFLDKEIINIKKRGYKFYSFKEIMRKINTPLLKTEEVKEQKNDQGTKADSLSDKTKKEIKQQNKTDNKTTKPKK